MTEAEWLACTAPQQMLDTLKGKVSKMHSCFYSPVRVAAP